MNKVGMKVICSAALVALVGGASLANAGGATATAERTTEAIRGAESASREGIAMGAAVQAGATVQAIKAAIKTSLDPQSYGELQAASPADRAKVIAALNNPETSVSTKAKLVNGVNVNTIAQGLNQAPVQAQTASAQGSVQFTASDFLGSTGQEINGRDDQDPAAHNLHIILNDTMAAVQAAQPVNEAQARTAWVNAFFAKGSQVIGAENVCALFGGKNPQCDVAGKTCEKCAAFANDNIAVEMQQVACK